MAIWEDQPIYDLHNYIQKTKRSLRFTSGIKEIFRNKWKIIIFVLYAILTAFLWSKREYIPIPQNIPTFLEFIFHTTRDIIICLLLFFGAVVLFSILSTPVGSRKIENELRRIGFINHSREVPTLLSNRKPKKQNLNIMEFDCVGIPLAEWEQKQAELQTALNGTIARIEQGKNLRRTILYVIPNKAKKTEKLFWDDTYLYNDSSTLVLGKGILNNETVNLNKTPHILLGGSTGSGKSVLLKILLLQCIKKNVQVHIADFKGGVDYSSTWKKQCNMIFDSEKLLTLLENIVATLEQRKVIFRDAGCPNIDSYNALQSNCEQIQRIILACDEVAEILDKTGLEKAEKERIGKIESCLSILARQGRAFGIHIILATQRPDANILTGQIKANLDMRICGKADKILSQIVLDNSDAAEKIPKDAQGQFITNTGILFQGYMLDESKSIF